MNYEIDEIISRYVGRAMINAEEGTTADEVQRAIAEALIALAVLKVRSDAGPGDVYDFVEGLMI